MLVQQAHSSCSRMLSDHQRQSQNQWRHYPRCSKEHRLFLVQQHNRSGIMFLIKGELLIKPNLCFPVAEYVAPPQQIMHTRRPCPPPSHIVLLNVCYVRSDIHTHAILDLLPSILLQAFRPSPGLRSLMITFRFTHKRPAALLQTHNHDFS